MAPISLKIISNEGAATRKVKFDTKMTVRDAHAIIKEKVIVPDPTKEHGLFLRSPDSDRVGIWLEQHRTLDYYMLKDGDSLEYICKIRNLRVKLLDGSVKTLPVDEGKAVSELMEIICGRLKITNYDEYGLCPEEHEEKEEVKEPPPTGTLTLKRAKPLPKERDVALETLSKKIQTDDNVHWLDQHSTLRELGVEPTDTVILKRRLFYSDRNVDQRDPVQLNLLYLQTRDAILNGRHLVTEDQAVEFAGIQCQIHYEDFMEEKHKPGFIENLNEFLPEMYSSSWGIERKLLKAYRKHHGLSQLEAKNLYIKTARDLPTYGVTFFLVKEKQKGKKKLVPRLLGINSEAILRMDENTKEILQQWPLTHVKSYHVGKSETFALNFGDYSDKEYCCKTQDAFRIREILEGYIDLIRRRLFARPGADAGDSMPVCHDSVQSGQIQIIQHIQNQPSKLMKETFVGPNKLVPFDQGSVVQQGTQVMTMQQIIQTNQFDNPQRGLRGEVAQCGQMPTDCVRKLKRMNSCSVKAVSLLAEPTEENISEAHELTKNMQDSLNVVEKGVQEIVNEQTIEESQQMLLNEMQDLRNYVNKLSDAIQPGHVNTMEAKDAAEKIVDLTTTLYCAQDFKTRRRSELLNRSKKSFIADEKLDAQVRRAQFLAAAQQASSIAQRARAQLAEEYSGPVLDEARARQAELALQERLAKLNAALALFLTAHSDPNNIDYSAASTSMNTIKELLPELALEGQMLASTKDPAARKALVEDLGALCEDTRKLCSLTSPEDHEKMQEALNNYADLANKLLFTFSRGRNAEKENELIELARGAGASTAALLQSADAAAAPAQAPVPAPAQAQRAAAARYAAAARDLLTCAQLTAPAITEPHCQSALTAAAEGLSSSVHQLSATWKPLVEEPGRQQIGEELHHRELDVHKALEKLQDAYATLGGAADDSLAPRERQRLKFINSLAGARETLRNLPSAWGTAAPVGKAGAPPGGAKHPALPELKEKAARRRLAQQLAQLNAAVARLARATSDPEKPDYETAESALNTIAELMPTIAHDAEVASARQEPGARGAAQQLVAGLCGASQHMLDNVDQLDDLGPAAAKFAAASKKLVFLISPGTDKGREKTLNELSLATYDRSAALLGQAHAHAHAHAHAAAARAELAARALLTVAQVTAPSIDEPSCANTLASALQDLQNCIDEVAAACNSHLEPGSKEQAKLQDSHKQFNDSVDKIAQVAKLNLNRDVEMTETVDPDVTLAAQREKKRLQFVNSIPEAMKRLDEAEQQMKEPLACVMMKAEDAAALQRQLEARLARLGAAAAALASAAADRENPNYEGAQRAVDAITRLMPEFVQDTYVLGATKSGDTQNKLAQQLQQLCRAGRDLCASAGQAQALNEAAIKFSDASGKLLFLISPGGSQEKEKEIIELASDSCLRASELLSQVQGLTQRVPGDEGVELDKRGAKTADAAQALLTTAQVTAPTITSPDCSAALVSAAEELRSSSKDLTNSCEPYLKQGHQEQLELQKSEEQLENSLYKLVQACKEAPRRKPQPPPKVDKQRLQFTTSVSGAKSCFDDAQQQLQQPVICALMREEDAASLQHQLSDRLAQLNAAIAALATATADRSQPDYASAQRAVNIITELMPQLVRDSRTLSGTKPGDAQQDLLRQVQQLCDASRAVCDNAGEPQALSEAAAKFSDASGKLMFTISPAPDNSKQIQIIELSSDACVRASELLSRVQDLTQKVPGDQGEELDRRGAKTADAAQALLTTAQVTAPSIESPHCSAALVSAAEQLRSSAKNLTNSCQPHMKPGQQEQLELQDSEKQLENSLDKLVQACKETPRRKAPAPPQKDKQRVQFVNSLSGAKNCFDDVHQQLKQPMICALMREEDAASLQLQLSDRLAQLNAAIAALATATADRSQPDYASAQRAVNTITELMPQLVRDARTLSATKSGPEQEKLIQQVQQLCDASNAVCNDAGQPQGASEATKKFSEASHELMCNLTPGRSASRQNKQQRVIDLTAASCARTSDLLSQVQALTQQVDGSTATDLDKRGADTADAAQALLSVAQVTAPSLSSPQCRKALGSAVQKLRGTAADLANACDPHLKQDAQKQQLFETHEQLNDDLDKLLQVSGVPLSREQQEKQRLHFVKSLSGAKNCFDDAQQQLKQPVICALMREEDAASLQHQLSDRLAQLNAAIAALTTATADRSQPDYASAQRAVNTITELMPQLVRDARTLSATKDGPEQQDMLRQVQQLCNASRAICDNAGEPQELYKAVSLQAEASDSMMCDVHPTADHGRSKQIADMSAVSCSHASELVAQAQALTQKLHGDVTTELDARAARVADAEQSLLAVAQVTAPSITSPQCQRALESAVHKLRESAADLAEGCHLHLNSSARRRDLIDTHQKLEDSLDMLLHSSGCKGKVTPALREKMRVRFKRSVSLLSPQIEVVEKQVKEPARREPARAQAAERRLRRRLAQLNAAVAALASATADHKNPDYPSAERSLITINELMPIVVQESKALSCTKDDDHQKLIQENLKELCDASRSICDNADDPKKLNESALKFAETSSKLMAAVRPEPDHLSSSSGKVKGTQKPSVPVRSPKTVTHAVPARISSTAQDFLDTLRREEDNACAGAAQHEKGQLQQFTQAVGAAEKEIESVESSLRALHKAKITCDLAPLEVNVKEQKIEDTLVRAGIEVAALISANYAHKLDYVAAQEPILGLGNSVRTVVEDGSKICGALPKEVQKSFVDDLSGLSGAARSICRAARDDKEKLNDAAIAFGKHSAKLLHVVSANVDPAVEKEVIVRARAIGDSASRLAVEATNVANNGADMSANKSADKSAHDEQSRVQNICTAGAQCVDAAGKLVYTAKLVAPTIHHTSCKDTLASSADTLTSKLAIFSKSWQPFASDPHSEKLTQESKNLAKLLEKLKDDVQSERMGKKRDVDRLVVVDTPLRLMTVQIIDNARTMVEHGDLSPEAKQEYREYHGRLAEALRAVDLANARSQRAPHDKHRRNEMDIAIQDLQMMVLQTRPSRAGQEPNNIVDFRDFLQGLVTESDDLAQAADKHSVVIDKRVLGDIKLLCSKISDDSKKLMNPTQHTGDDSYEDMMEIYEFGQECDHLTKELSSMIRSIPEAKARAALLAKLLPVAENSNYLRFATNCAISTVKSAAYDAALAELDDFQHTVVKVIGTQRRQQDRERAQCASREARASSRLLRAGAGAARGEQHALRAALTSFCMAAHEQPLEAASENELLVNVSKLAGRVKKHTEISCLQSANWMAHDEIDSTGPVVQEIHKVGCLLKKKPEIEVVREEDIERLLSTQSDKVEGTPSQVEEKFQQLSTKLSSMSGSVFQSVRKSEALARSLHAAADAALQLAAAARALRDMKKPVQSKKIDDATHEMCLATYDLLKTSEVLCQNPDHHDTRRRLLEACYHVNDSINKLNRGVWGGARARRRREAAELLRALRLHGAALRAAAQPAAAGPYAHCLDALHSQRDLLLKMNSDQAMSLDEFLKSMLFITTAVTNSTECAAQATYLLSVSENDKSIAIEGLIDVPKMKKNIAAIHDTCVSIILNPVEQVQEEKNSLEKQVEELLKDLDESAEKTKDQEMKKMLKKHRKDAEFSAKSLYNVINKKEPADLVISFALGLDDDIGRLSKALDHPALVPTVGQLSQSTQALCDDVLKHSTELITNTQELIKEIESSPEQCEVLKWTSFSKRKDVLSSFDALLKSIKSSGQSISVLEAEEDASEQKSYVQIQTDTAFKWLHKPMAKSDVKANGQKAVKNLIDIGNKMAEDLQGADKEDMRHVVEETEQLLMHCSKKYDQEQYSLLMERIRELKKAIERMAVTRVVEDFMDAEEPLADLDILADAEREEKNRKFLLERKIAELLAQLARVGGAARFVARSSAAPGRAELLLACSAQTELLAPLLVKAAEERVHKPDNEAVIENYKALLARYTDSLSKVRDLCDQSVDPMDFVQTAGETMQRMREDSINEDPMKCALTSAAITKLANRVIHVSLASRTAQGDPELQRALAEAQQQLSAATPAPDTRASKMPDWRDTTAKILHATGKVESVLGGEAIFNKEPDTNQPIYNEALNLHVAIRDWSSRDNEIVAVAKRMAVLMAKLSAYMNADKQHEVLTTSKAIVAQSHEVARLAKKLAHECSDHRIKTNLLQVCERIPTISGQLKMLTTVKGSSLGHHGTQEDKEAMDMLVGNAQSLMISIQDVVKAAASASVKIMSQRGPRIKWVRKTYY